MSSRQVEGLLRGITNKDQKQEIRKLLKRGWTACVTSANHVELTHEETGATVKVALTGGSRSAKNTRARAAKALRRAREREA